MKFIAGERVTWWPEGAQDNRHLEVEVRAADDRVVEIKVPGGGGRRCVSLPGRSAANCNSSVMSDERRT